MLLHVAGNCLFFLLDHVFIWWVLLISFSHLWWVHIESFPVCTHAKSFQLCLTLRDPQGLWQLEPICLFCPWNSPGRNTGMGCHLLLPDLGIELASLRSPVLADGFLTPSATWEAQVGSHSLLWGIFLTQGLNPGLLHRQILYHLHVGLLHIALL